MPTELLAAWRVGVRRIMSVRAVKNWLRYIFLASQSLLLLAAIIVSFLLPSDSVAGYSLDDKVMRYMRVAAFSLALLVNFAERFLFWCCHAVTDLREDGAWNFRADIIRLFLTEFFIFISLLPSIYLSMANGTFVVPMVFVSGLLHFFTAIVMKLLIVVNITYSLFKARVNNVSGASKLQSRLLYGLCFNTCAQPLLQVIMTVLITSSILNYDLGYDSLFVLLLVGVVPTSSWFLYFLDVSPWGRFFPISMALDVPPNERCPEEIDSGIVSSQFQRMYGENMSCKGFTINLIRMFTSPLFVITHLLFLLACTIVAFYLLLFDGGIVGSISIIVLVLFIVINFLPLLYGVVIALILPFGVCVFPGICAVVQYSVDSGGTAL